MQLFDPIANTVRYCWIVDFLLYQFINKLILACRLSGLPGRDLARTLGEAVFSKPPFWTGNSENF